MRFYGVWYSWWVGICIFFFVVRAMCSVDNGKHTLFCYSVWYVLVRLGVLDGEAWRWRRMLFAWKEELVVELMLLLQNVFLQVDKDERWLWTLKSSHAFSVRSVYKFITIKPPIDLPVAVSSLWQKDVPLKVVLFAWGLFRDRLPTKDNLHHRSVIDHASTVCVVRCGLP